MYRNTQELKGGWWYKQKMFNVHIKKMKVRDKYSPIFKMEDLPDLLFAHQHVCAYPLDHKWSYGCCLRHRRSCNAI